MAAADESDVNAHLSDLLQTFSQRASLILGRKSVSASRNLPSSFAVRPELRSRQSSYKLLILAWIK